MENARALTTVHVRLDGVERIVLIASELLDVNMDPVTNPLNATVMPDGLDLSVKDLIVMDVKMETVRLLINAAAIVDGREQTVLSVNP